MKGKENGKGHKTNPGSPQFSTQWYKTISESYPTESDPIRVKNKNQNRRTGDPLVAPSFNGRVLSPFHGDSFPLFPSLPSVQFPICVHLSSFAVIEFVLIRVNALCFLRSLLSGFPLSAFRIVAASGASRRRVRLSESCLVAADVPSRDLQVPQNQRQSCRIVPDRAGGDDAGFGPWALGLLGRND